MKRRELRLIFVIERYRSIPPEGGLNGGSNPSIATKFRKLGDLVIKSDGVISVGIT